MRNSKHNRHHGHDKHNKKAVLLKRRRDKEAEDRFRDVTNAISVLAMFRVLSREFTFDLGRYHGTSLRGKHEKRHDYHFPLMALAEKHADNAHEKAKVHAVAKRKRAPKRK